VSAFVTPAVVIAFIFAAAAFVFYAVRRAVDACDLGRSWDGDLGERAFDEPGEEGR